MTVICGANDVLASTRPDLDGLATRLERIFDRLLALEPVPLLLTATYPTAWGFLELGPRTRRRIATGIEGLNEAIRSLARWRAISCLEIAGHPGIDERRNFAADGLHPSPRGHREAARAVLAEISRLPGPELADSDEREEPAWSR
jgi:lysophospholipase L1-like esterase